MALYKAYGTAQGLWFCMWEARVVGHGLYVDEGGHNREHQSRATQQDDRRVRVPRCLLL